MVASPALRPAGQAGRQLTLNMAWIPIFLICVNFWLPVVHSHYPSSDTETVDASLYLNDEDVCVYYFPPEKPNAHVIIDVKNTAADRMLSSFTLNYFIKFLEHKNDSYIISAFLDDGSKIFESHLFARFLENNGVPMNEWMQVTQTWQNSDGETKLYLDGQPVMTEYTSYLLPLKIDRFAILGQRIRKEVPTDSCETVTFYNRDRFVGYLAHLKLWDNNDLNDDQWRNQVLKGLTVYSRDFPQSLFEEPFQMRGGVESFPYDCPNCYGRTTPYDDEACGTEPWSYETWMGDGTENSEKWPAACKSGAQMPINVETVDPNVADPESNVTIGFLNQTESATFKNYTLINNGKTIKVILDTNNTEIWKEFEFHWPSEFELNGQRYPMEMRTKRCEESTCTHDVFLYDVKTQKNEWMEDILPTLKMASEPVTWSYEHHDMPPIDLTLLLKEYMARGTAYSISGGNTIPPCEDTNFMIYEDIGEMDFSQFKEFMRIRRCKLGIGKRSVPFMFGNFRQRQPSSGSPQRTNVKTTYTSVQETQPSQPSQPLPSFN